MDFNLKTLSLSIQILTIQFAVVVASQHEAVACYGNHTSNSSTYAADLNTLLASLSSSMPENGFNNAGSVGGGASAMSLCRPDIDPTACSDCVTDLSEKIQQLCPDQFDAVMWSEFCMLRYSNHPIFGTLATFPARIIASPVNVSTPRDFGEARETLIGELRGEAAGGGALQKAAAGNTSAPDNQTIYGLVQCTPDLSGDECRRCLGEAARCIPGCREIPQGITVNLPSCSLRYEIYVFYQTILMHQSLAVAPQSATLAPGDCHDIRNRNTMIIVVSMVAAAVLACVGVFVGKKMKQKMKKGYPDHSELVEGVEISSVESIQYDFGLIRAATDDFSDANKLGQGGFGAVYKGKLENGKKIAVKRLSKDSGQGNIEFKNEVLLLARLQHRNLVRLLGFSIQGVERLLVYEFVHNGSLDRLIFGGLNLEWEKRYKIIGGVARGVLYLHQDSRHQIIHRDLKASNVLLDQEMNPKISDFGLAKLVEPHGNQLCASRIVGTYGYMAPEYANRGHFSIKLDVYSFGVLVLEIVSGQRINEHDSGDLLAYAWRRWQEGRGEEMIESVLMGNCSGAQQEEMLRCIHIGLLCVQQNPDDRPTMAAVVMMLHSFSQSLPLPLEPGFYIHTNTTLSNDANS